MAAINQPFGPGRRFLPPIPVSLPGINWWVLAAVAVVGIGAALPVLQNSVATSRGFDVHRMQNQEARLNGEIRLLEADVAMLTSLQRIERRAAEIGLVPSDVPLFVSVDEPGPAPAKIPAEYLPGPIRVADAPESWWQSLLRWLPLGN